MVLRAGLFLKEAFLFSSTMLLSILLVRNYTPGTDAMVEPISFSQDSLLVFLILFSVLSFVFFKFKLVNRFFFRLFLFLVVFSGSQSLFSVVLGYPVDFILSLGLVLLFMLFRNVFIHDIGIVLGIAGISGVLGMSISPQIVIIILIALSFYDIIAVYWTKHMVYLAKNMMESGAIFGFIIPFKLSDIFLKNEEAHPRIGEKFMVLGSGDIGMPAILASSVAVFSLEQSLIVALFAVAGLFATHFIFINQGERRPMAALPPIATLTIIGYLVSQLL